MKNSGVRKLTAAAVIGALYALLTIILQPSSYGPVQFRVSEVLCVLPFFFPGATWGLTAGCIISNLFGPYGLLDIIFGSLATMLAGLCTAAIGKKARQTKPVGWGPCAAACLMPVLFNGVIVGAELAWVSTLNNASLFWGTFALYAAQIGGGEAAVLFVIGLPALRYLLKNGRLSAMLTEVQ